MLIVYWKDSGMTPYVILERSIKEFSRLFDDIEKEIKKMKANLDKFIESLDLIEIVKRFTFHIIWTVIIYYIVLKKLTIARGRSPPPKKPVDRSY